MISDIPLHTFRRIVTISVLVIVIIHLLVALTTLFLQDEFRISKRKIPRLYQRFVHLGPFYREDAIQSSPHLVVQAKGESRDYIQERVLAYRDKPWRLSNLTMRDYAHRQSNVLYNAPRKDRSPAFRKLSFITRDLYPNLKKGDTVTWVYYHRYYLRDIQEWENDTLFIYSFNWKAKNGK